jgi:hypothetical protein
MQEHDFDADTQQLLGELQLNDGPDSGALGRVRERLAVTLTATLVGSTAGGNVGHGPLPIAASTKKAVGLAATSKLGLLAAFALGTTFGAIGYGWLRPPVERVVYRDRRVEPLNPQPAEPAHGAATPAPMAKEVATSAAAAVSQRAPAEVATPPAAPPNGAKSASATSADGLAGELRLIDKARAALAAGDSAAALSALQSHATRHPHGTLEQEREALRVKALVAAGRDADARAASRRFAARYPHSTLLDSVNAAVRTIP